ncbi:MAG: hypothetical protein ABW022_19690 [Actinoplanes sp.]
MAIVHIVVLSAALALLLGVPCAFTAAVRRVDERRVNPVRPLDEPAVRRSWSERCRQDGQGLRELDRAMRTVDPIPALDALNLPSIEQIEVDLRRLDRQRRIGPTGKSLRWLAEVQRAYDDRLCLACLRLGLSEHLRPLEGMDREIERIRVEGQLEAAGLTLRS